MWSLPGQPDVEDYAEYRLLQPDELRGLIARAGFDVLALHDNRDFRASDLTGAAAAASDVAGMRGRNLYLVARRDPAAAGCLRRAARRAETGRVGRREVTLAR